MTYWRTYYHIVWGTKNREPIVDGPRAELVRQSIAATASETDSIIHAIGIMPDHVHVAISIPPRYAVADVVKKLKGTTTYRINQTAETKGDQFMWQPEYGVLTFEEDSLPDIIAYVEHQREHHASQTLKPTFEYLDRPQNEIASQSRREVGFGV